MPAGFKIMAAPKRSQAPEKAHRAKNDSETVSSPEMKVNPIMSIPDDVAGTAALAICESLLLALNDHNILPEKEIVGLLRDAAAAHENPPPDDEEALHAAVAAVINGILAGGNSVHRR